MFNEAVNLTFRKLRSAVAADDTSPTLASTYADLDAANTAGFNKVMGRKPILIFEYGGTGTDSVTYQVFCVDKAKDFSSATKVGEDVYVVSCLAAVNLTAAQTKTELDLGGSGSHIFVKLTSIPASTTVSVYIADDASNG